MAPLPPSAIPLLEMASAEPALSFLSSGLLHLFRVGDSGPVMTSKPNLGRAIKQLYFDLSGCFGLFFARTAALTAGEIQS